MSAEDRVAQQMEAIVASAHAAAEQIRVQAERDAEEIRAAGRREAEAELERSRKQALEFDADTRREAKRLVDEAEREARQVKQQTRRAVEGRVAGAEEAAAQVLEEAEVLSSGLRRLGELLTEQGERILRDVQAAHRSMQAELRVGHLDDERTRPSRPAGRPREELDVPAWIERGDR